MERGQKIATSGHKYKLLAQVHSDSLFTGGCGGAGIILYRVLTRYNLFVLLCSPTAMTYYYEYLVELMLRAVL